MSNFFRLFRFGTLKDTHFIFKLGVRKLGQPWNENKISELRTHQTNVFQIRSDFSPPLIICMKSILVKPESQNPSEYLNSNFCQFWAFWFWNVQFYKQSGRNISKFPHCKIWTCSFFVTPMLQFLTQTSVKYEVQVINLSLYSSSRKL